MSDFLPYCRQDIDKDDIEAVVDVLRSDWLTTGPAVDGIEAALNKATGAAESVVCNSGTAALHLVTMGLGLKPGDQVIVPAITFVATANAARYVGADVVFADVDSQTGLMTPETLLAAIKACDPKRLKAVFAVHLAGRTCNIPGLAQVLRQTAPDLKLVEDACHALGGTYPTGNGEMVGVGAHPDSYAACFSLHPAKMVTTGEGGAVTTADPAYAAKLRELRSHGLTRRSEAFQNAELAFDAQGKPNPWYYELPEVGYNYRLSDINCALGTAQLLRLSQFVAQRAALVDAYDKALAEVAPMVRPQARTEGEPGWHLYTAQIDFAALGKDRAAVMRELHAAGIGTQVHYIPVQLQPYYQRHVKTAPLPGAWKYYSDTLSLPLYAALTEADVRRVATTLGRVLAA